MEYFLFPNIEMVKLIFVQLSLLFDLFRKVTRTFLFAYLKFRSMVFGQYELNKLNIQIHTLNVGIKTV